MKPLSGLAVSVKTAFTVVFVLIFLIIGAGCSVNKARTQDLWDPEIRIAGQTDILTDVISKQYPDRFDALHRASLNIRGKIIQLRGYLKVDRSCGEIHLLAQAEMGGTLFEVHILNGKPDTVLVKGFFKKTWLEESVVKDLKYLYLIPFFDAPFVTVDKSGRMILTDNKEGLALSHVFTPQGRGELLVSGYRQLKKNRLEYEIDYHYDQDALLPGFITVKNNKLNYTLNLEVRYMGLGNK